MKIILKRGGGGGTVTKMKGTTVGNNWKEKLKLRNNMQYILGNIQREQGKRKDTIKLKKKKKKMETERLGDRERERIVTTLNYHSKCSLPAVFFRWNKPNTVPNTRVSSFDCFWNTPMYISFDVFIPAKETTYATNMVATFDSRCLSLLGLFQSNLGITLSPRHK